MVSMVQGIDGIGDSEGFIDVLALFIFCCIYLWLSSGSNDLGLDAGKQSVSFHSPSYHFLFHKKNYSRIQVTSKSGV
jgi:hypothetical protein